MYNLAIRLTATEEIEMFEWLRAYFNLPADLPLGLSEKGEPQPIGKAVTTLVWGAFGMVQVHQEEMGSDLTQIYETGLQELLDALAKEAAKSESPADRAFAESAFEAYTMEREAMLRIAQGLPDVIPEINRRYYGAQDAFHFFESLVTGQQHDLFLVLART